MSTQLSDIVTDTTSNSQGLVLYDVFKKNYEEGTVLTLVISQDTILTSSFLNTSIGKFIEDFGIDALRGFLSIKTNSNQIKIIKRYVDKLLSLELQS